MTYKEREQILSKDVMTLTEFALLMDMDKSEASRTMVDIKAHFESTGKKPRIKTRGKLHVQDYLDYYRLNIKR